jgi:DNA-binding NarL/FixJ family response regulator
LQRRVPCKTGTTPQALAAVVTTRHPTWARRVQPARSHDDPRVMIVTPAPLVTPRVVIADPQPLVAEALETLLAHECAIVGHVSDGRALLQMVEAARPDVAVMDVALPLLNGLEAGQQARHIDPSLKIVIVTANEDPDVAAHALRVCASAYVLKRGAASELMRAIHEVMQQRTYVTPLITGGMVHSLMHGSLADRITAKLTTRQREVLQLLAEGKSMKEAADILGITARTVAFHKYRMMEQLKIHSSAELIRVAYEGHVV